MDIEEDFINYIGADGMNYYCCEADDGEYQKELNKFIVKSGESKWLLKKN